MRLPGELGFRSPPSALTPEAMAAHVAAWTDLATRALEPSLFHDPAFGLPAALYLPGRRPRFLTAWDPRDPSRLIGLCCVAAPRLGLPRSAWLHPQATAAFPLLDAAQPRAALADLLTQAGGLLMHGLPAEGATLALIQAHPGWSATVIETRSRAVLRRMPEPLQGKAGKEFRRQERRLAEYGKVRFTVARDPAAVLSAFDSFLALEARGWKGRRGTALGQDKRLARFARAMVSTLATQSRCRIDALEVDGEPVAMGVVLRSGATGYFWKTTFDQDFARFSPGAHLAEAIGRRQAAEPGLQLTDSCAIPGHAMIDRLWPERMTVVDAFVAPSMIPTLAIRFALQVERTRRLLRGRAVRLVTTYRRWQRSRRDGAVRPG